MEKRICEIDQKNLWGRCSENNGYLTLYWPESGPEFKVRASEMYAEIEAEYDVHELFIDVFVGSERLMRFPLQKGKYRYLIFRGFDPANEYTVRIARNTQFMPYDEASLIKIHSVDIEGEILDAPKHKYRLEFIGDSLTSGEGCGLTNLEEWIPAVFDSARSYPFYTAINMDASVNVLSQSGYGLYSSWDGNVKSALPLFYPYVCGSYLMDSAAKEGAGDNWNFEKCPIDAVIINLGTNDGSAMKLTDMGWTNESFAASFKKNGVSFLKDVRSKNPNAQIVWAYGMLGLEMKEHILDVVNSYIQETGDEKVSYFELPDSSDIYVGKRNHPTPQGHKITADALSDYLKSILM